MPGVSHSQKLKQLDSELSFPDMIGYVLWMPRRVYEMLADSQNIMAKESSFTVNKKEGINDGLQNPGSRTAKLREPSLI